MEPFVMQMLREVNDFSQRVCVCIEGKQVKSQKQTS